MPYPGNVIDLSEKKKKSSKCLFTLSIALCKLSKWEKKSSLRENITLDFYSCSMQSTKSEAQYRRPFKFRLRDLKQVYQ